MRKGRGKKAKNLTGYSDKDLKPLFETPKYTKRKPEGIPYKPSTTRYSKRAKNE